MTDQSKPLSSEDVTSLTACLLPVNDDSYVLFHVFAILIALAHVLSFHLILGRPVSPNIQETPCMCSILERDRDSIGVDGDVGVRHSHFLYDGLSLVAEVEK